jgi:hypothetical protein
MWSALQNISTTTEYRKWMVDFIAPTIAENKVLKESVANLEARIRAAQDDQDRMEVDKMVAEEQLTQAENQKNGKCLVLKTSVVVLVHFLSNLSVALEMELLLLREELARQGEENDKAVKRAEKLAQDLKSKYQRLSQPDY